MSKTLYRIENSITAEYYVGSSIDVHDRFKHHRNALDRGDHENKHLQASWNLHGEASFSFIVTASLPASADLRGAEQVLLDKHIDDSLCMNICRSAYGTPDNTGVINTIEHRIRKSEAIRGRKLSPAEIKIIKKHRHLSVSNALKEPARLERKKERVAQYKRDKIAREQQQKRWKESGLTTKGEQPYVLLAYKYYGSILTHDEHGDDTYDSPTLFAERHGLPGQCSVRGIKKLFIGELQSYKGWRIKSKVVLQCHATRRTCR